TEMVVHIATPATSGVRAWAHGPLNGVVAITGGRVDLTVRPVPPATFVEARVAVPARAFTVAPVGGPRLRHILAEEQVGATRANNARRAAADEERRREDRARWLAAIPTVVAVLGWIVFLLLWRRWGREPRPPADVGAYWR